MIHLIRVYDAGDRVIFSKALDKNEVLSSAKPHSPKPNCRCYHVKTWVEQMHDLAYEYDLGEWMGKFGSVFQYQHGHITLESIYPTPKKRTQ